MESSLRNSNEIICKHRKLRLQVPGKVVGESGRSVYDVSVGFVTPPIFRLCIASFAVAEGWLLLNIG